MNSFLVDFLVNTYWITRRFLRSLRGYRNAGRCKLVRTARATRHDPLTVPQARSRIQGRHIMNGVRAATARRSRRTP